MNPKKNNTKEPEGTQGDKHHPNIIDKSEPLIASDVRGIILSLLKACKLKAGWKKTKGKLQASERQAKSKLKGS